MEEIAGGFQLLTRPRFGGWLRRLHQAPVQTRLSGPALETLAVVAYRQPIVRAEVESIRGVQCGEMLRQLMERDLVRIVGRSEELGRPFRYGTTRRFLQVFGLRHLDDLPRADVLRAVEPPAAPAEPNNPAGNGRIEERTLSSDLNEESQVSIAATLEPANEDRWKRVAALSTDVRAEDEDDLEDDDADEDDDYEDEDDDEDDDDDLDEDDDDVDDDLEEEEWEEVDDDDEEEDDEEDDDDDDWDDDDDDWDDDDEDEDEDEDFEEED